jgi:hypothetical protein
LAHQHGLKRLSVEPIQYPTNENGHEAICRAVAESEDGAVFSDIGDANPSNVHAMVSRHILRIASTRAKARVLRDFVNIGMTCLEELGDLDEVIGNNLPKGTEAKNNGNGNGNGKHEYQEEKAAKGNGSKSGRKETSAKQKESKSESSTPPKSGEPATKSEAKGNGNTPKMSEAQSRAIMSLSRRKGISSEELEAMALKIYNTSLEYLSSQDASSFIRELQSAA